MLDISRLIWRARRTSPSGIDRVELAYAEHFLTSAASRPAYGVVRLSGWLFGISPKAARRFIVAVAARWQGSAQGQVPGRAGGLLSLYAILFFSRWRLGLELRRRLKRYREPPILLFVSPHHLSRHRALRRIKRYFGARCVCLLYDLIPIDYPEYVEPGEDLPHRRAAETIARRVDAVIAISRTTAESFEQYVSAEPGLAPSGASIHVALLGVRAFLPVAGAASALGGPDSVPYFIVLGTIEPKKNHLLLLNLWGRMATTMARPPRLHVIGTRGWENEQVVDMLERSRRLHGLVHEHNRLNDAGVAALLANARAVLVPSFVEGFGLPLAEALASGVPVICSDIPASREVGRDVPEYVDPLDLPAWEDQIIDYSSAHSARRAAQLERLSKWQTPTWAEHFGIVQGVLDEVASRPPTVP
jgi:glycosyltransferase involved in cell wall biosynthesis